MQLQGHGNDCSSITGVVRLGMEENHGGKKITGKFDMLQKVFVSFKHLPKNQEESPQLAASCPRSACTKMGAGDLRVSRSESEQNQKAITLSNQGAGES